MKRIISAIMIIGSLFTISSCYYDNEALLYPGSNNAPCTDTTANVSYSKDVVPLMQAQCYGCHNSSFPSGNITMGSYTTDKAIAQSGKLYGVITYTSGYSPMPKGSTRMNNCQVALIKKWIDNGMPNN
jgi:hypothetical protein